MNSTEKAKKYQNKIQRVGVIGGGQLAWMMADAAKKLGVDLIIQTPEKDDPAVSIAKDTILAEIDDARATAQLANSCDVITFENEFINIDELSLLSKKNVIFRPNLSVLKPLLDKYQQLCYLRDLGLPVPQFWEWETEAEAIKFPLVLKARRHGYDGHGISVIQDINSLKYQRNSNIFIQEFIPFDREVAIIAARSVTGEIKVYPVVETQQENQVCRRVFVCDENLELVKEIQAIAQTLLNSLEVVGVFGIELFITKNQTILINEIAPRTHNSGHYTLDACETSQFEQHLRAVCGLPLGSTALKSRGAVMVNLLGYEFAVNDYLTKRQQLAQIPNASVWWYGKTESRPGRKLGHVTVLVHKENSTKCRQKAEAIAHKIESIWQS
ncbi:MAG: 5-(carboxyamino)imidazole ribonucleotide synthase [Okeania sp. SIO2G4]|uniref:5-(carboxyamino)imidazole ribonucleotide synthase n=1 Tax=unclassified Okeania TaxID=2634635 RepID=UPI0013BAF99F|nr:MULTISPECIES: 5-(carboxyamino)imidazole ribonucleotide synthase [unclassified Okeania]NEP04967.1 5-(carboxyamino)imidazole ribonucleotide synthase [Okeania sp. SIO4D6]NEP70897.1 5-(carboxyamino)imidazole ribonucleotide synthase [Okeania sp. SIO2G5]NEP92323.1 5-(carboxyamino)imidazole ribonucleotide synthase [Okeania sp. SIO2F5]NEQ89949.1 5-(carboxyamino)imidazole ribonucleotide synthase [Okeania sp. SIO2G4]